MEALSIRNALRSRRILLTGSSGFVGKFWLVQLLAKLPELGPITLLIRPKRNASGAQRFEDLVNSLRVFEPLHERYGAELDAILRERIEVVEGDIAQPDFGLDEVTAARLRSELDLVVNCAGLTDFNPDPRLSLKTNVAGALNAAAFVRSCDKARLLHISTCYVAGLRDGEVFEHIDIETAPSGAALDPDAEYAWIRNEIQKVEERYSGSATKSERGRRVKELRELRDLVELGTRRATHWNYPNIYTYCKSLAERLLARHYSDIVWSSLRPAIVESSVGDPISGWNEGIDGSGPLAFALRGWFRRVPVRPGNPFDIVPVDFVGAGMTIAAAALIEGVHAPVYQVGTTHRNRLTIDRATELTGLYHRKRWKERGAGFMERSVLSRWDAKPTVDEPLVSVSNMRVWTRTVGVELQRPPKWVPQAIRELCTEVGSRSESLSRQLKPLEKMLEAYRPFVQGSRQVFRTDALNNTVVAEPEFRFAPEELCWRHYWLKIHMPALEKYCFPKLENREPASYTPPRRVVFVARGTASAAAER